MSTRREFLQMLATGMAAAWAGGLAPGLTVVPFTWRMIPDDRGSRSCPGSVLIQNVFTRTIQRIDRDSITLFKKTTLGPSEVWGLKADLGSFK